MLKSNSNIHYILSVFWPIYSAMSHGLLLKPGIGVNLPIWIVVMLGMSYLIEWSLGLSEKRLVRWGGTFFLCLAYIFIYLAFDNYVLKMTIQFTGFSTVGLGARLISIALITTIFLERIKWRKAREKAKIENLALQTENIETKFKLLREQVNPEFLFYCLKNLKKMVQTDNPQTEEYILKMADVYRKTLITDINTVLLTEELELVQAYMYLMRSGREAAVKFDVDINANLLGLRIPVFALQQVADNCLKYNHFSAEQPLHIRIFHQGDRSVTITNNCRPRETSLPFDIDQLEMRYTLEGVENGVYIEKEEKTYSTTLKLI